MRESDPNRVIRIYIGRICEEYVVELVNLLNRAGSGRVIMEPRGHDVFFLYAFVPRCESELQSWWYSGAIRTFVLMKESKT